MAVTAGAGLAFAGSVYQLLFRNPLAAPDIIGVSSGASVGASVSILFFGGGLLTNTLLAFTGGLTAVGLALLLARGGDRAQYRHLCTGWHCGQRPGGSRCDVPQICR